jgi:hypothetical protein
MNILGTYKEDKSDVVLDIGKEISYLNFFKQNVISLFCSKYCFCETSFTLVFKNLFPYA